MFVLAQPVYSASSCRQSFRRRQTSKRPAVICAAKKSEDEGDFITNLVGSIFGKKVIEDPEPAGLKRMCAKERLIPLFVCSQATKQLTSA